MRRFIACFTVLLWLTGCTHTAAPVPTPLPSVANDELAPFRLGLTPAHQNDLDGLDRPTRYVLTLTYDPVKLTLNGTEEVRYFNRKSFPLEEVYFRLFANLPGSGGKIVVTRLSVNGAPATAAYAAQNTALKVSLTSPLAPGASVSFTLDFVVTIPRDNQQHYADFMADPNVITLPSVSPLIPADDARGWHIEVPPAYGDLVYADSSLFSVTLTTPSDLTVIASGSLVESKENPDRTVTRRIVAGPVRDWDLNLTYRLQKSSVQVGDTTVNSFYQPGDSRAGQDVLKYAADALRDFSRFGPYPYREFDIVETPTTAGGIEYPGVIVINQGLYKEPESRGRFEFTAVHEVAHQWWYGVVGNDQVNYPWVDESLTQYTAVLYEEDAHGSTVGQTILREYIEALYLMAKKAGHDAAVNQPVSAFNEGDYTAIVYGKGPLFYDAIRKKMGDAVFFRFLSAYYEKYRYKVAFPDDILATAQATCNCSLDPEYRLWITGPAK